MVSPGLLQDKSRKASFLTAISKYCVVGRGDMLQIPTFVLKLRPGRNCLSSSKEKRSHYGLVIFNNS